MGSHVWTRETGGAETTQRRGPTVPRAVPGKRKANVWKRGDPPTQTQASTSGAGEELDVSEEAKRRRLDAKGRLSAGDAAAQPSSELPSRHQNGAAPLAGDQNPSNGASHSGRQNGLRGAGGGISNGMQLNGKASTGAHNDVAAAKRAALAAEAAQLRRKIQEQEARIAESKAAAERKEAELAAAQRTKRQEQELRKSRLDAGFAEAFRETRELAASAKSARTAAADEAEVRRVLAAKSDHEVMQLKPGKERGAIKKKYREMTLALHPDKCKVDGATDAFQRLVHAYQGVLKFARCSA